MKEFLDEIGGRYIVQRVKQMINAVEADSVTKQELQAELDALDINIDLSSYATKEELTDALRNIDLSSYATKEYVTDAINNAQLGGDVSSIDLSIYAKKSDLDSKADTQHTHTMSDITDYTAPDLSSYAKKTEIPSLDGYAKTSDIPSLEGYVTEEQLNAKGYLTEHQDLSAYALKTEIPSTDGLATTEYVDNAIANVPSGGNVDLSNYYTKDETYSKTEVDTLVANSGDSSVPILSMEDWIELNTQYDENVNFKNKKVYFDTSIAFRKLLNDKTYCFYLYDGDGTNMYAHNYVKYENGKLTICHCELTPLEGETVSRSSSQATIYDKTQSDGEFNPPPGRWVNGWGTTTDERFNKVLLFKGALQLNNWISTPNFGFEEADMDSYDIDGKELYIALLKSIIKIEDENGNEIAFKTVPTQKDYLEYVNNLSGGGSGSGGSGGSSSGGSSNVYSTTETAIGTWIDGSTIYRKVIEYGKLSSVSSGNQGKINISFGETIEKIINASALISHTNGTQMVVNGAYESAILVPTTSSVSKYADQIEQKKMSFISTSKTSITFYYGRGYASYDATFIVEYTKPAQTS